jgi:hypothetical protein
MSLNTEHQPNNCDETPATPPQAGADLRLKQQVSDALSTVAEGEIIDQYFGITSGLPQQSPHEAQRGEEIVEALRQVADGNADLSQLFGKISAHNPASGLDPEALRALMRGSKQKPSE